jgi:hypothetical protein
MWLSEGINDARWQHEVRTESGTAYAKNGWLGHYRLSRPSASGVWGSRSLPLVRRFP